MSRREATDGMAVGDALLVLSVIALVFALAYPRIQRRALRERVAEAVADAQAVVDATERFRLDLDDWPQAGELGVTPPELAPYLPGGFSFDRGSYQLSLQIWETAEEAPTPAIPDSPPQGPLPEARPDSTTTPTTLFGSLAGVTVRSADPHILAGLLDHFGSGRSFLQADRWTLVFASVPGS